MSKKFRLLMVLVLVIGLLGGLMTASTVSADPAPGTRIQIPRIDVDDLFGGGAWSTRLQIQNLGAVGTWAAVSYWGTHSDECPGNDPGLLSMWHKQYVQPNGIWTLTPPSGAKSAIVWSFAAQPTSGPGANATATRGEDLAVTVDRWGPDLNLIQLASSYVGISESMEDDTKFFAPYVMYNYNGSLDTTITIQNSGEYCTSVWIYYKEQGNCEYQIAQHITELAPGEAIRVGPGGDLAFPAALMGAGGWLGSAYISANEPLGIIVDQWTVDAANNAGTLLTFRGLPYNYAETKWYADFLYREISGWTSSIQVQNLTRTSLPTFVTVNFMDQSGDEILFLGDWICRNGTETFYLPAIIDLGHNFPFGYVGAAEIESHDQVDYPGGQHDGGQNIFVVVDMKKTRMWNGTAWVHTVAGETQGGAYNAHPEDQKEEATGWALPFIARQGNGVTSKIVIRNNSNCNKIRPVVHLYDETGKEVYYFTTYWLRPKHMTVIDLNNFPVVTPGFVGAAKVEIPLTGPNGVEQLCDTNGDGITDLEPVMPSVVVMNYSWEAELGEGREPPLTELGDLCRIYEGIPYDFHEIDCNGDLAGTVYSNLGTDSDNPLAEPFPLYDAKVEVVGHDPVKEDQTDSTGWYEIPGVKAEVDGEEQQYTFKATKSGFADCTEALQTVTCNAQGYWNPELRCNEIPVTVNVTQTNGTYPVEGATVTLTFTTTGTSACIVDAAKTLEKATNVNGIASWTLAADGDAGLQLDDEGETVGISVSKAGYDTNTVTDGTGAFGTHNAPDFYDCADPATREYTVTLCAYFTVYGNVNDDGTPAIPYVDYKVKAEGKNTGAMVTPNQATGGVTDASGNYALEISRDLVIGEGNAFFIRVYTPSDVLVYESAEQAIANFDCGSTNNHDVDGF